MDSLREKLSDPEAERHIEPDSVLDWLTLSCDEIVIDRMWDAESVADVDEVPDAVRVIEPMRVRDSLPKDDTVVLTLLEVVVEAVSD